MKVSRSHQGQPFLIEIGCEEIPARFLEKAQRALGQRLETALQAARLLPSDSPPLQTYSTPRRLVAWVPAVLENQPETVEEVLGPPGRIGLDSEGKPTKAAESFALKNYATIKDLLRVKTPKGEYLALKKRTPGRPAREIFPEILPAFVTGLSFPKSMYWLGKSAPRFIRPIRWLLSLIGEGQRARTIPFEVAGLKAGTITYGHRAMGKTAIRVSSFQNYSEKLRKAQVEIDPTKRRESVRAQCKVILENLELNTVEDRWLEDWVVNSTEWPRVLVGNFDKRFLKLPREILVTVMRDHQKYFAVEDREGNLEPRFIAVLNSNGDPKGLIRAGHERVLAARFTDAEFFWNTDRRIPFDKRTDLLAGVTYEEELGSYADKVSRMKAIARELAKQLQAQGEFQHVVLGKSVDTDRAMRAIELAKCDLTTHMVQEFPELQGVVGGLYARAWGEAAEVHEAIYDHYLPKGLEDRCPRTLFGAVVSLADKIDSVAAGFAVGHEPTGSSDPFALRRQGNGVIKVLLELKLATPLKAITRQALNGLDIKWQRPRDEVFGAVLEFFNDRLRYYLETARKFRYDTVRAVLAAGWDPPLEAMRRAEALEAIRGSQDLEALSVAAKRIKNILAKSASSRDSQSGEVEVTALREDAERKLHQSYLKVAVEAGKFSREGQYKKALTVIAGLRPDVDRFFDKVLVMAEEPLLRQNRLRLLGGLDELFSRIAHFAEIGAGPSDVDASTSKAPRADP